MKRKLKPRPERKLKIKLMDWASNPPVAPGAKLIYSDLVAIIGRKTVGGREYRHDFSPRGTRILGLPDGSLLIPARAGRRLWGDL